MKAVGRNTAIRVNVVAITARPISSAASIAAWYGVLPMRRWRTMFSTSTIASSTRMPTTSDSASKVTTLIEKPSRYMPMKAGITDIGSAMADTKVARQSRRNSQTTSTARIAPSYSRCSEPWYSSCTGVTKSKACTSSTSGRCSLSSARAFCTAAPTATSLSPRLRATSKPTTGLPLSRAAARGSATVSVTVSDLVQPDAPAIRKGQLQGGDLRRGLDGGERAHRLLAAADVGAAAGALGLHLAQLPGDLGGGRAQGLQARRVQRNADLAAHAADAVDRADTAHRQQLAGDVVVDEPGQRLFVHARRIHREGQHRLARQVHLGDDGLAHVARQLAAHARYGRADVVDGFLHRLFQPEFRGDGDDAILHLGVDVLEALQRGDRVLDLARHVGFQLRRRRARQRCGDAHRRQVDVREVLHLHGIEGQEAAEREQHEQHHRRNRVADRPGGDVHHVMRSRYCLAPEAATARRRRIHQPHQVAVVEEPGAGRNDAGIGGQPADDLQLVPHQPAGLHLDLAHTRVGIDAVHVAEAIAHHHGSLRHRDSGRGAQVELAAREHAGARAGGRPGQGSQVHIDQGRAGLRVDGRADHPHSSRQPRAAGRRHQGRRAGRDAAELGGSHFGAPFQPALPDEAEQLGAVAHHRADGGRACRDDAAVGRVHLGLGQPHLLRLHQRPRRLDFRLRRLLGGEVLGDLRCAERARAFQACARAGRCSPRRRRPLPLRPGWRGPARLRREACRPPEWPAPGPCARCRPRPRAPASSAAPLPRRPRWPPARP